MRISCASFNVLHRSRCPNCFGNEKKTTEQFKQEVYDLVGDEYSVIEEYSGASNYIRMAITYVDMNIRL